MWKDENDLNSLTEAVQLLENETWASRITAFVGKPIDSAVARLPERARKAIGRGTEKALHKALLAAVATMHKNYHGAPYIWSHRGVVAVSGAAGGFFGWPGMVIELPISTVFMLRSIADIGRHDGEDLNRPEAQLACVQVFAFGGRPLPGDDSKSSYYAVRIGLAGAISKAAEFIAEKGMADEGAPAIVSVIARIAARFGAVVEEKAAAEFLPILGAAGGASVNLLFLQHFQQMARGHFAVRRLERKYGEVDVKTEYERIRGGTDDCGTPVR